jgi:trimeric autotransporter adhesin
MERIGRLFKFVVVLVASALGVVGFGLTASAAGTLAPTATTDAATGMNTTTATLNGTVNPNASATSYYFQYGPTVAYGLVTTSQSAGAGSGAFAVSAAVTGLTPNITYYFQLVATNFNGTSFGGQQTFVATATATVTPNRVSGADRYQTSATIAETKYPAGAPSGNVVLATGADFPDALAGNYLAGQLSAPIVLTPPTTSDPAFATTTGALTALHAAHVYILGGTTAVGNDVQTTLGTTYTVTRIGGTTRYDTMQMVDTSAGLTPNTGTSGSRTAIVANGNNFPDALAAGPLAWADRLPIVLTDGTQTSLSPQATATISADAITHFIVMGGSAAIDPAQVTQLGTLGTVDAQLAGVDRTDTAAQFALYAQDTYGFARSSVILAAGQNFPDALSAGAWGGDTQDIYLTDSADDIGSYTTTAFEGLVGATNTLNIAGGLNAVDATAATEAQDALQGTSGSGLPLATTTAATSVTTTSAVLNGTVDPNGTLGTYYFEYGTTTSYGLTTSVVSVGSSTGAVSVSASISGLTANTTYYFQLVAINSDGTTLGGQLTLFTGNSSLPIVTTGSPSSVTSNSATLNGTVNPNGSTTTYFFEYGLTTAYGSTTSTQNAGAGTAAVPVAAAISGLAASTTYDFQLVASNGFGTSVGGQSIVSTPATNVPTVTSVAPSGGSTAGTNSVTVNGTNLTGATAVHFGATAGTAVVVNGGGTQLTVTAPARSAGVVDVTVTTPSATSATSGADQYTYVAPPTMTSATVTAGTYIGGTTFGTPGTIEVTFSEAVSCNQASDYVYSSGAVSFTGCSAVGSSPSTQWVLTPAGSTVLAGSTAGNTLTYTRASPTTSNATYAAAGTGQAFETSGNVFTF